VWLLVHTLARSLAVVPMFQPAPALTFFERFLAGEPQ
jgi:hypothetical protein